MHQVAEDTNCHQYENAGQAPTDNLSQENLHFAAGRRIDRVDTQADGSGASGLDLKSASSEYESDDFNDDGTQGLGSFFQNTMGGIGYLGQIWESQQDQTCAA